MERRTLLRHPAVDVVPIVGASTGKHPVDSLAGNFLAVNVAKPRARQSEPRLTQSFGQVDKADTGKKLRDAEGIDIGARRHAPGTRGFPPIVVELTLTLRHQLSPKSRSDSIGLPLISPWMGSPNRRVNHDYVEFARRTQDLKTKFLRSRNSLWSRVTSATRFGCCPPWLTKENCGDSLTALPESDSSAYLRRWPRPMRLARSERAAA